jgi:MarR family 2-MHQ and catechol resistance regulon transcriptional repressor
MSIAKELELDRPMSDIRHELVLNIVRTANLMGLKAGTLFRHYDLTEAQFNVLFSLKYKERDWTQSDLGKSLVVTRASITSVLDKLEAKGLVRRSAVTGNRRIYHVCLTDRGLSLVNEVEPTYRENIHRVCKNLDDGLCHALIGHLEAMRREIEGLA